ncbi:MAG: ABC transporter permease [Bacilli bacterium]
MMNNEHNEDLKDQGFQKEDGFYAAGSEVKDNKGQGFNADDFKLVQQDKSIHDVKFTTKPTTFLKDAMHRFSKNHSSVAGGIILGCLFLLALILPIDGIIPYQVGPDVINGSEVNLAPKIFATGTGFMDGTINSRNTAYPYKVDASGNDVLDEEGNLIYVGTYDDPSVIVSVSDKHIGYGDVSTSDATGGFAWIIGEPNEAEASRYVVSTAFNYNLSNTYKLSYSLGWRNLEGYEKPEYCVFAISGSTYANLTDWSEDYGSFTEEADSSEGQTVSTYATVTDFDLTSSLKTAFGENLSSVNAQVGFAIKSKSDSSVAMYLKEATFTSNSTSVTERVQMASRSFTDANSMVSQPHYTSGTTVNPKYWATNSSSQLTTADAKTLRCNIVYDTYKIHYGLRSKFQVEASVFTTWQEAGYITGWDPENPGTSYKNIVVTELGQNTNSVYIVSVDEPTSVANYDSFNCSVIMWKQLGYDSMPIHIFGTDKKGRDILKYVFLGLRTSLILGIVVSLINIIIGVIWGSISGYFGGLVDLTMERIVDILNGIPWIVLMTVLVLKLGSSGFVFVLSLCLTGWIGTEAVTRSQFYRYRDREYVLAARTLGAHAPRLIFRHILPNAIGTIITSSILMIPSTIFTEATISYLGLGFKNLASLGVILSEAQGNLSNYPYQLILPAVIISLLMICFNLFGNGLRDAFNPSLKGTE